MSVYVLVRLTMRGGSTFFPPSCCAACQHSVAMATIPGSQVCSKGSRVAKRKLNGTGSVCDVSLWSHAVSEGAAMQGHSCCWLLKPSGDETGDPFSLAALKIRLE